MRAYRTYLTINDPTRVVLKDLPFEPGQRVEVLLISQPQVDESASQEFRALLKETQALPQLRALSDAEIAAEIAVYRSSIASRS